ncbi:peptide-methionine (S)-S-oxide reductase [Salipaludibacillus sp. HK11]|uniref:peptide-methionine (S)-S-oxide reductase n=1 Tax=Salipaludibacillus sp. HK11 TaxID=3394320 RepID=UPI0039FCC594
MRTRVGYSGGSTSDPTYRKMGDHTESIEIDFDPDLISYEELLYIFWGNHNSLRDSFYKDRQYMSLLLYHNEEQREQVQIIKRKLEQSLNGEIQTEIAPYARFYRAEDYHQKYYLKRYPNAVKEVANIFSDHGDFVNATIAGRLNGFVAGHGNLVDLKEEIKGWGLNSDESNILAELLTKIKW